MNLAPCPKPEPKLETRNSPVSGLLEHSGNIWHSCCREPRQEQSRAPVPIPKGAQSAGNGAALPKPGWQRLPGRDRRRGWAGSGAVPFSQGKKAGMRKSSGHGFWRSMGRASLLLFKFFLIPFSIKPEMPQSEGLHLCWSGICGIGSSNGNSAPGWIRGSLQAAFPCLAPPS